MISAAIIVDGKYRENMMDAGVYNYVEKYTQTSGGGKDGLYCYNFKLDTNPYLLQPNGAFNTSKYSKIELELTTITPPLNKTNYMRTLCARNSDGSGNPTNNIIGTDINNNSTFEYNYDIILMEERYNILTFVGGNVGLMYSN